MPTLPTDDAYRIQHPDWRASHEQVVDTLLQQLIIDREVGRDVQLDQGGPYVRSGGLTMDEMRASATRRAQQVLEDAIRRQEDQRAVLRRKRKTGHAA